MQVLYNDPTLEGAQRLEIAEKRCGVCERARWLRSGASVCSVGKKFPSCRDNRQSGFRLVMS